MRYERTFPSLPARMSSVDRRNAGRSNGLSLCSDLIGSFDSSRFGSLEARSTIVSLTRRTAVVQVEVDNDGRPCGLAQGTVLIAEPRAST